MLRDTRERRTEYYATARGATPFREWRNGFTDVKTKSIIDTRIARLRLGNCGDSKAVGEGVSEARIQVGPGYRIYYAIHDLDVILLCGGDKKTQDSDIARAKTFWKDHKERVLHHDKRDDQLQS